MDTTVSKEDGSVSSPAIASPTRAQSSRRPSLLPAFEPLSSSPFPRPQKRKLDGSPSLQDAGLKFYPTPIPTSSTGILPSSPARLVRPGLQRTTSVMSTLSERHPLGALPTVDVPADGAELLLGRSSNSSNYQLSANRLISRVHVRAKYNPPSVSHASGSVQIECLGWNGITVHCRGKVHALGKGDMFTSDKPSAEIMLDVQETRVIVAWPAGSDTRSESVASDRQSDRTWTEDVSPSRRRQLMSSPPLAPRSPESPTPGDRPIISADQTFIIPGTTSQQEVQIYEDPSSDPEPVEETGDENQPPQQVHLSLSKSGSFGTPKASFNTNADDDFSDHDEENDPIVHSFGPFGENILPNMAAFTTSSPAQQRRREPLRPSHSPQKRNSSESTRRSGGSGLGLDLGQSNESETSSFNESPMKNHVINQLAFSRLHSIPLSTILGNLPAELKNPQPSSSSADASPSTSASPPPLTGSRLKIILDNIPCIGEIPREGKDAAGKALENEYYYVPEMDSDVMRREAFVGSRGSTGLRSVRKSHKVSVYCHSYY